MRSRRAWSSRASSVAALLATGGAGLSLGHDAPPAAYAPLVRALPDDIAHQVLVANPRELLTVKER